MVGLWSSRKFWNADTCYFWPFVLYRLLFSHLALYYETLRRSKGANFLADFLLNPGVSDLTGSFRLYERAVLEEILPQIQCKGYAFQMEIIVRSKKAGFRVNEVPITFVDRIYGESKLGAREIILYIQGLLQLFFTT